MRDSTRFGWRRTTRKVATVTPSPSATVTPSIENVGVAWRAVPAEERHIAVVVVRASR